MRESENAEPLDEQLRNLRSNISDLGHQIDSRKTGTAAALGLGVFLLLLAAGAAYDLSSSRTVSWLSLGITHENLVWLAWGLGVGSVLLLLFAAARIRRRDQNLEAELDQMEQEYAELLDRKKMLS